jgi:hypothetical protein
MNQSFILLISICPSPWLVEVEPMVWEFITKNEIINKNWMYTVSANVNGRMSYLIRARLDRKNLFRIDWAFKDRDSNGSFPGGSVFRADYSDLSLWLYWIRDGLQGPNFTTPYLRQVTEFTTIQGRADPIRNRSVCSDSMENTISAVYKLIYAEWTNE